MTDGTICQVEIHWYSAHRIGNHELLEKNGEGELTELERKYLDELMEVYNDSLLTKAKALRVAVERGLIEPLSSE